MTNINNPESFKELDPKNVFESTGLLAKQSKQIWEDSQSVEIPENHKLVKNIVISGMGGSSYGAHIAVSLFKDTLPVPLIVNNDYDLPSFVNSDSLIILTSYSGSTEETLSCAKEALEKHAKVIILTSGGKLAEFSKENSLPALVFDSKNNPSGQPRLGTGYIVIGTIIILQKLGFVNVESEVLNSIAELENNQENIQDQAKGIAEFLKDSIPVIFASQFLSGNAHIIRNQFNETSKSFSAFSELPELNHHLMEGLKNPEDKKLKILFLSSDLYSGKVKNRLELTKQVIEKNNVDYKVFNSTGTSKMSQVLGTLSFGGYLTFYLAILYGLDPSLIPWVDYFKEQLSKGS